MGFSGYNSRLRKDRSTQQVKMTQNLQLSRGNEELISSGGNALLGRYLRPLARTHLPTNFQPRRSDAISDRDILLTMTGMLCRAYPKSAFFESDKI